MFTSPPRAFVVPHPSRASSYWASLGRHVPDLGGFAEALARSPVWETLPPVVLVVRSADDSPGVVLFGRFNDDEAARIKAMVGQLATVLPDTRYIDYAQAETDCAILGERIREVLGSRLSDVQFTGIPRGGIIVLGMLSYVLNLHPSQIVGVPSASDARRPLVVVDDCMLTGARLRETLEQLPPGQDVLAAALYAVPALSAAVEAEGQVMACLRAQDLLDCGPDRFGDRYDDVQGRWLRQAGDTRYWVGVPEHVCFSWTEPDVGVWNATAGKFERGLFVIPPSACLKNKYVSRERVASVQHQSSKMGPLHPAPHTFVAAYDEEVLFANVATQTCVALSGTGADMWATLCEHPSIAQAESELLQMYDVDPIRLRADLHGLVERLVTRGLFTVEGAKSSVVE